MKNLTLKMIIFAGLSLLLFSCNSEIKFNKSGWNEKGDLNIYPNRNRMLNDLLDNHKIKGLKLSELRDLLGEPEITTTSESISADYNIVTEYGNDIDPIYVKELRISLNIDSVAQSIIVTNWKK